MMKNSFVLIGVMIIFMFYGFHSLSVKEPDCIGSIVMNEEYDLQIVANRPWIKDKVSFAWSLYEKCKDNTFYSTMFSYDITGYPRKLTMEVYLREREVEIDAPIMEIKFSPSEERKECNIKEHSEKYVLYIDGEKME